MAKDTASPAANSRVVDARRAAGQQVRQAVLGNHPNIKAFCATNELDPAIEQALSRIMSGRKKIDPEFAAIFAANFGQSVEYWLTLEHSQFNQPHSTNQTITDSPAPPADNKFSNKGTIVDHHAGSKAEAVRQCITVRFEGMEIDFPLGTDHHELVACARLLKRSSK